MSKATTKANEIISLIENGIPVEHIKIMTSTSNSEWYSFSSKAYNILLVNAKKERKERLKQRNVSAASNEEIVSLLALNETLANYALLLPSFATTKEFEDVLALSLRLPESETEMIEYIARITLGTRMRALQKKGRIEKFDCFKIFTRIVDAAIISYYRTNFISCYLTLIPVIEGILIRWMGYTEEDTKPEFEDIRRFFKNSPTRQPFPWNIQFHDVYVKACDKILNHHFYKPTRTGRAYSNFNRHVASHLLQDDEFATKEDCIRLFLLLDTMTEIYYYESRSTDLRFSLKAEEFSKGMELYGRIVIENLTTMPEHLLLGITGL